jgi:hypothetical protein
MAFVYCIDYKLSRLYFLSIIFENLVEFFISFFDFIFIFSRIYFFSFLSGYLRFSVNLIVTFLRFKYDIVLLY